MEKQSIIDFFDRLAPTWDEMQTNRDAVIEMILDNVGISKGQAVLDVACGTGVLFPHYLRRQVESVTAVDISPEMVRLARKKFSAEPLIHVLCGDVQEVQFDWLFDRIVVYNAFPHFPDGRHLIKCLASLLKQDGRLTIAHGFSQETINAHHSGTASKVSNGLMPASDLSKLFIPWFDVDICISNEEMYQVSGTKKQG